MSLRINTNVTALTAHSNLVNNDDRLSGSIERLSSGLRINRAADDAAGLTISEKLRTQVRGINRAILNVQDGISLIQTAEGALNEIQSMLQRMRELALQSANDTLTSTDRMEIQKEVQQLKDDINRISYGTEFNTRKLLDGTGTAAITTTDPTNLDGVVAGGVLTFSDFSVVVYPQSKTVPGVGEVVMRGTPQEQRSAYFVRTDGVIASGGTTLQSITNFYDNNGTFILDLPQTLYTQGDNHQGNLVVSKDITLDQLAARIQAATTTDQLGGGLHFEGSTTEFSTFDGNNGQLITTSGKNGKIGRISFTGEENLVKALGFQEIVSPEDPVYSIAVTNIGVPPYLRNTLTTQIAGHRAAGLIEGVDLVFQPPTEAFVETQSASLGISIPAAFTFGIGDSNGMSAATNIVAISVGSGAFSMGQIASIIDGQLVIASSSVRARINDSYAIEFYTLNTGSAAWVDVINASANVLGIINGRYSGSGGGGASIRGTQRVTNFVYSASNLAFSITDAHNINSSTQINLTSNYTAGGLDSIVDTINAQLSLSPLKVEAVNNNGYLQLRSLETGVESFFSIVDANAGASLNLNLFINPGGALGGTNGNPADQNFEFDAGATFYGFVVAEDTASLAADTLSFGISDLDGAGMTINVPSGVATAGASFRNLASIVNLVNSAANTLAVKVNAAIDTATQTIRFFSTTPGKDGVVTVVELGSPDSLNTVKSVFDFDAKSYKNGSGNYAFTLHIKDTSIQFQIGPNQGHTAKSNIVRTDVRALGIEDLDLTNIRLSEEAIGLIDKALQKVSSERAKLGAIENRMTYTTNSLRVSLQNMSASESRIRDVDMAREVIELTRFQVLQQSSNAMLAQANATPKSVLDLLR